MNGVRSRVAEDSGISVVEVLVAAIILALTATAIATISTSASRSTYRGEQDQVVVNRLQNELEHIRQLPFSQVALTARPTTSNQAQNPAERVSADGTRFDLNWNGTNARLLAYAGGTTPDGKPMTCGGTGQPACRVNPGPEPFRSGDVSGEIYRYVTYPGVPANCPGCSADYFKRIIVIIQLGTTAAGGAHSYQEIQSNVSSPDAVPSSNPVNPTQTTNFQVASFSLTDTACTNSSRIAPTASHATHDTRGRCDIANVSNPQPPDLLATDQVAGTTANGTYDYSTDVVRSDSPNTGLAILRSHSTAPCPLQTTYTNTATNQVMGFPTSEPTPQLEMHTWASEPLNATFRDLTTTDGSVTLWTRSVGGAAYQGGLCIYLFKRVTIQQDLNGSTTTFVADSGGDAPAQINQNKPYLDIQRATWPQAWTRISTGPIDLRLPTGNQILTQVQNAGVPGSLSVTQQRLGLAVTVDGQGTSGDALEVMYDDPTFDSKVELDLTPQGTCIFIEGCS